MALRREALRTQSRLSRPSPAITSISHIQRRWESMSQSLGSDHVRFPGAVTSKFTSTLEFTDPTKKKAMDTYRVMDASGRIVDTSKDPHNMSSDEILKLYKDMLTVSIMDPIMYQAQRQGRLSFYMVSAGEEGIAVGSASGLDKEDVIFAQYREAGVMQHRGFTLDDFMNQLFANAKDSGAGRNMPVHYGSRELNVHTISSPLATQLPQAAGAAYALKLQHLQNPNTVPKRIVACYFGEGAASEGDFHAALNIAATRNCPVVFICRNNGFAISTPTLEQYRGDGIASRGVGYGIDTIRVDGNDIFAVREATLRARQMALEGDMRPVLIEAMSYRVAHHSTSDDSSKYRENRDVENWKRRDNPITRLRKWMESQKDDQGNSLWSEQLEKDHQQSIKKAVLVAFNKAEREKKPPLRRMFEDVYEEVTEEQRAQIGKLKQLLIKYPEEYDLEPYTEGLEGLEVKATVNDEK